MTAVISSSHAVVPRHTRERAPLLSTRPKGRFYYCIHFTEKENNLSKCQNWNLNPGGLSPEPTLGGTTWPMGQEFQESTGVIKKWGTFEMVPGGGGLGDLRDRLGHENLGEKWAQNAKGLTCLGREFGLDSKTPRT